MFSISFKVLKIYRSSEFCIFSELKAPPSFVEFSKGEGCFGGLLGGTEIGIIIGSQNDRLVDVIVAQFLFVNNDSPKANVCTVSDLAFVE